MFWIFVFLTVIFLFLFQLYVLQDAIMNMDTATALVNASKYFFLPKHLYNPPEKARILSELLLLLPHQNFWFMVSKDHIFWPDKVENLSVKLSYKPEIIGKIRVGTSMSSARRPDFLTDFLWGPEERWEVAIGSLLLLLFHVLSQKFTTNSELAQRRHSHDKSCWPKQLFLLFCRHHTHNVLKFEIKSNCLKG